MGCWYEIASITSMTPQEVLDKSQQR